jgi:curved DNA-binding protein CbpA
MTPPQTPPQAQQVLAQLTAFARTVEPTLDSKSYYDLLNLEPKASVQLIRRAFYDVAAKLHPDRYAGLQDRDVRQKLETIYTRIAEGYRVLSDPMKRKIYDDLLSKGQKRLIRTDRERRGPTNPEDAIKHPEAKKFFRMAILDMEGRKFKSAVMNLQFAGGYDPTNEVIREKLKEARQLAGNTGSQSGGTPPK